MRRYNGYFIDLDGTMYRGNESIQSAAPFVNALRNKGIPYLFVTNNSTKKPAEVVETLDRYGIPAIENDVFTSSMATAAYIQASDPEATCFVIGEDGLKDALHQEGIVETAISPTHVVVGSDRSLTYEKLAQACLAIRDGATFISTNSDIAIPTERGLLPGNGAITQAIATSTGVEPLFIGKPSSIIMDQAIETLGVGRNVVMVGDNYETDIQAGMQAQIDTLLVCTGVTKQSEVAQLPVQPTHVCMDLAEWI